VISFSCSQCGKSLSVKDEFAGKKGKCPDCGQGVVVPLKQAADEKTLPPRVEGKSQLTARLSSALAAGPKDPHSETLSPGAGHDSVSGSSAPVGNEQNRELFDFLAPAQGPDELGRLGPYRVLKVLGAGGMGVVFQAEDPMLKRKVALKAMLPSLAASESARKRFLREAQTAAAIEHDHIVHIYQVGEDRGVPFMAMQFLKGQALEERLQREAQLPLAEVVRIGREAALGLAAAHAHGLVHRDIKPANLWLEEPAGRVKILDFGLARAAQEEGAKLTQSGAIIGTPAYMAPEQANGQTVDGRTDLFSLGCVLYRLCTGTLPFQGKDTLSTLLAIAMEEPGSPREVNAAVPKKLSDLIMKLLAKAPDERPESADKVAALLADVNTAETRQAPPPATPRKERAAPTEAMTRLNRDKVTEPKKRESVRKSRPPWLLPLAIGGPAVVVVGVILVILLGRSGGGDGVPTTQKPENGEKPHKGVNGSGVPNERQEVRVVGHWHLTFTGASKGQSKWEFREDHKALENGREMATWKVEAKKVVLTYQPPRTHFGAAELEFKDDNTLVGKNTYLNGRVFYWVLTRPSSTGQDGNKNNQ
jgi:serine/threonine protein kinase